MKTKSLLITFFCEAKQILVRRKNRISVLLMTTIYTNHFLFKYSTESFLQTIYQLLLLSLIEYTILSNNSIELKNKSSKYFNASLNKKSLDEKHDHPSIFCYIVSKYIYFNYLQFILYKDSSKHPLHYFHKKM